MSAYILPPDAAVPPRRDCEQTMSQTNKAEALSHAALCAELDDAERVILAEKMGEQTAQDGEALATEGEVRQTLFVLVSGRVEVRRAGTKGEEAVYEMKPGECAGTRVFIDESPRMATLRSKGESHVLTLEPADVESLIESHPHIVYKVMRALTRLTHENLLRMNRETDELQGYFLRTGGRY